MKYIITDVEGTTTSISFVHETLFPFAKKRLCSFLSENADKDYVRQALDQTIQTVKEENNVLIDDQKATETLMSWIESDRKHPALKSLQGYIWEEGYRSGEIQGHVYDDVLPALKKWSAAGILLGVYSSGSVKAQHLIFEFSNQGNLRPYFTAYFDTRIGHKREVASYENIAKELKCNPSDILFLSDIKEELDAAQAIGIKTIQLVRQSDVVLGNHKQVKDFSEITLD